MAGGVPAWEQWWGGCGSGCLVQEVQHPVLRVIAEFSAKATPAPPLSCLPVVDGDAAIVATMAGDERVAFALEVAPCEPEIGIGGFHGGSAHEIKRVGVRPLLCAVACPDPEQTS
jgi:hypothetical protein